MRSIVRPQTITSDVRVGAAEGLPGQARAFAGESSGAAAIAAPKPDDYAAKLVKYVPGEVIAFYAPAYALVGQTRWGAMLVLAVGALGTFLYLEWQAHREEQPQPWSFYVLAIVAFLSWSLGTSTVGADLLGMSAEMGAFVMLATVLLVPAVDGLAIHEPAPKPVPTS